MDTQKVVVILLIVAILFSVGTIWKAGSADTGGMVAGGTNTVTTIEGDTGNVGVQILPPPEDNGGTG
jgi:hypothetical protein